MGNRMDTKMKEDPCLFEITETVITNFKHHIDLVDHSVSGLARAIDTMRATCKALLQNVDNEDAIAQAPNNIDGRSIIEMINTSVLDQKIVAMRSLSKLIHFVVELADSHTDNSEGIPTELEIDKYITQQTTSKGETSFESHQSKIDRLLEENSELKTDNQREREKVNALTERNSLYVSQQNDLKKEKKELEKALQILKRRLDDETTTKEIGNNDLTKENKMLKNTVMTLEQELEKERSNKEKNAEENRLQLEELLKKAKALEEDSQHLKKEDEFVEDQKKEYNMQYQSLVTELTDEKQSNDTVIEESVEMINVGDIHEIKEPSTKDEQLITQTVDTEAAKMTDYEGEMDLALNIQRLKKENETLKVTVEELKAFVTKLELTRENKVIPVQWYCPRMTASTPAEEDLIKLLKLKLEILNKNLKVVILQKPDHLQTDIPVLVICTRACYMWSMKDTRVLRDFNAAQIMALGTFHEPGECKMITEMSTDKTNSKQCGVFNFRQSNDSKHFTLDDTTISEIGSFIMESDNGSAV